jgi:hypothetical protein
MFLFQQKKNILRRRRRRINNKMEREGLQFNDAGAGESTRPNIII